LQWKMLDYFMCIWNIWQPFGISYDHLLHFVFIWYIFPILVYCTKKNLATLEWTWANQSVCVKFALSIFKSGVNAMTTIFNDFCQKLIWLIWVRNAIFSSFLA
jgi:hypothetical protein